MDYTQFPSVTGAVPPPSGQTTTTSFTGGGTIASGTVLNWGGPTGVSINGTGIWAGASTFAAAPFSVDTQGNLIANSLIIGGFVPTGGAAADVNANSGTVNANKINAATLSAITANLGTITAGTITGVTITGGVLQTATSGQRVTINESSNNSVNFYDSSGTSEGTMYGSNGGTADAGISIDGANKIFFNVAGSPGGVLVVNSGGVVVLTGSFLINNNVGFYGTTPISQPTVTGSRGGNAALANLLTALANLGLIVDSTT